MQLAISPKVEKLAVQTGVDPSALRLLRVARIARLVRLMKTVDGFDEIVVLTAALKGSVNSAGRQRGMARLQQLE